MASVTDICNLALGWLGDDATVSSITPPEGSAQAEHCQRFYPIARDAMLSLVEPKWATKRKNLALLTPAEQPDIWTYAYTYPNCVKVLSVGLPEATMVDADRQEWDTEALDDGSIVIYTNSEDATVRVVDRVTDTTKFPPLFVIATARMLESMLAGPIVKGVEGAKLALAIEERVYKIYLPNAIRENAGLKRTKQYQDFVPSSIAARA